MKIAILLLVLLSPAFGQIPSCDIEIEYHDGFSWRPTTPDISVLLPGDIYRVAWSYSGIGEGPSVASVEVRTSLSTPNPISGGTGQVFGANSSSGYLGPWTIPTGHPRPRWISATIKVSGPGGFNEDSDYVSVY